MTPMPLSQLFLSSLPFKVYAVCCVILFLKIFAIVLVQIPQRAKAKAFVNPEDAHFFAKGDPVKEDIPIVQRAAHVFRNDLENIPMFLFLSLIYVLLGCWDQGALIYFPLFTFARISHTICYFKGIQPARSAVYALGVVISLVLSLHILLRVVAA